MYRLFSIRLLERYPENSFLLSKASHALSLLISAACQRAVIADADRFIEWIIRTAQNPTVKSSLFFLLNRFE
jgi:hypothetical protein